jgi:DNA-binding NarL/FixJ family response regulator
VHAPRQIRPPLLCLCIPRRRVDRFGLTRVEFQLVVDMLSGYEDAEVARRSSLAAEALDQHLAVIFEKFGVVDRFELALTLATHGF